MTARRSSAAAKMPKLTPSDRSERYKQAARELGCDESEERFNDALKAVAKDKPVPNDHQSERPKPAKGDGRK
jgi:hypothetical protein